MQLDYGKLKIALIGQSQFGAEVYKVLRPKHEVVGVFTIPDIKGREDPLGREEHHFVDRLLIMFAAQVAAEDGVKVFKFPRWRKKGETLSDVFEQYRSVGADLNVLPFCSQFIPMDVRFLQYVICITELYR